VTALDDNLAENGPPRGGGALGSSAIEVVDRHCRQAVDGRRAMRGLSDWARRFGLSEPELQVLWKLREVTGSGLDQTTLSHRLALSPAQVSATVERLCGRGWISPVSRPDDRRRRLWQLSEDGRRLIATMLAGAMDPLLVPESLEPEAAAPAEGRKAAA
jgi:DNA-binding MarR family transcriptional regulator